MAPSMDKDGVWGQPTSTLDWCEENYIVTPYIAEFWNTISNIVMIVPPLAGAVYYWRIGLERRFVILNLALLVVGIGSWLFHMTLKYEMQLLDELPMIYGTAAIIYTLHHSTSGLKRGGLGGVAVPVSYCTTASIAYITMRKPILHQAFYGALVFMLIYKSVEACKRQPKITPYVLGSFLLYLIGFILWNFENAYCSAVRRARHNIQDSTKAITQLHAWWHLFSGVASSLQIVFAAYARCLHNKQDCSVQMLGGFWPYLKVHQEP